MADVPKGPVFGQDSIRRPRQLQPGFSYLATVRCNNRRFNLTPQACLDLLRYAIQQAKLR